MSILPQYPIMLLYIAKLLQTSKMSPFHKNNLQLIFHQHQPDTKSNFIFISNLRSIKNKRAIEIFINKKKVHAYNKSHRNILNYMKLVTKVDHNNVREKKNILSERKAPLEQKSSLQIDRYVDDDVVVLSENVCKIYKFFFLSYRTTHTLYMY